MSESTWLTASLETRRQFEMHNNETPFQLETFKWVVMKFTRFKTFHVDFFCVLVIAIKLNEEGF